jgi:hypothetical protein
VNAFLTLLLMGFKIWMVVDAIQRRAGTVWLMVIFFLPFGDVAYYFMVRYKAGSPKGMGALGDMRAAPAEAPPDLSTLRRQYQETASIQNQVLLAQGLYDAGEAGEASDLFQDVLRQRSTDRASRYGLARCHLASGAHTDAILLLKGLIAQDRAYLDFAPWNDLVDAQRAAGDHGVALTTLRGLVQASPRLDHKLLLAQHLITLEEPDDARAVLVEALEAHSVAPDHLRRSGRQAAGVAQELLGSLP